MNILIVGLGSIGRKHVAAIQKVIPSSKIFALRSNRNAYLEPGVINIFSLNDIKGIDFAIISTPTFLHKETIQQLLYLDCPLFIEKPIYNTLDNFDQVKQIEQSGNLNYIGCNLRFLDCLFYLKSYLSSGLRRINEVNVYCGSYLPAWRPNTNFRDIYSVNPEQGGGVHLDLIHEFDYIYWFFGSPIHTSKVLKNNSSLNIDSYDYANYCLEYQEFCVSVVLNYFRRDSKRKLEIVFEDNTWEIDLLNNTIICENKVIFESQQKIIDTYIQQMSYFIDLVKNRAIKSENSVIDAYNVLKICLI